MLVMVLLSAAACKSGTTNTNDDGGAGPDAASDGGLVTSCTVDEECGEERGCLSGLCRDLCWLGMACVAGPPMNVCHEETYCVECEVDADCEGGNYRCDTSVFLCEPRPLDPSRRTTPTSPCWATTTTPIRR